MKGIVFTEFLEMVEERYDLAMVDQLLSEAKLASGGVYTAVGTYDHREMVQLLQLLSQKTSIPIGELLKTFGEYLFPHFAKNYPQFFRGLNKTSEFLERLDGYIHVEVKKLYPDAELPSFSFEIQGEHMRMIYESPRCMSELAVGLIKGCMDHFGEKFEIRKTDLSKGQGRKMEFILIPLKE